MTEEEARREISQLLERKGEPLISEQAARHTYRTILERQGETPISEAYFDALAKYARIGLEWCTDWEKTGPEGEEMLYRMLPESSGDFTREGLIEELVNDSERHGNWEALRLIVRGLHRSGRRVSPALADWVDAALNGSAPKPSRRGRPVVNIEKKQHVGSMIRVIVKKFGLPCSRRATKTVDGAMYFPLPDPCFKGGSAVDVVGVAAIRAGYRLTFAEVDDIWKRYGRK